MSSHPEYSGDILTRDDDFRLLELQPGNQEEPIVAHLFTVRLSQAPPYEAISYVWGDSSLSQIIEVSRVSPSEDSMNRVDITRVPVTHNSWLALKRVRQGISAPRIIWIDSICINQNSILEKNHQLTLMSRIYGGASRVVVHLGESADESDTVMDSIREVDAASGYGLDPRTPPEVDLVKPSKEVLETFFARPWFERIWVLQEIEMAKEVIVYCGGKSLSWTAFGTFKYWNTSCRWVKTLPYVVSIANGRRVIGDAATILRRELSDTRHCQSTDPRDRLFALLPLLWQRQRQNAEQDMDEDVSESEDGEDNPLAKAENEHEDQFGMKGELPSEYAELVIDYSLSSTQVFVKIAEYLINAIGPHVLSDVIGPPKLLGLPSWVPDWTMSTHHRRLRRNFQPFDIYSNEPKELKGTSTTWKILQTPRQSGTTGYELHGEGTKVGVIEMIGKSCDIKNERFPATDWEHLLEKAKSIRAESAGVGNGSSSVTLASVLTLESHQHHRRLAQALSALRRYDEDADYKKGWNDDRQPSMNIYEWAKIVTPTIRKALLTIIDACDGQRFFVTNNGYVGLAPENIEKGDLVFSLRDASIPFILRAAGNRNEKDKQEAGQGQIPTMDAFTLIGDCYVHQLNREATEREGTPQKLLIQ